MIYLKIFLHLHLQNLLKMLTKEENIIIAAEKLFAEKGFNGTSTREISKAANINISMISYYFGSKEKLFEEIFKYRSNEGQSFANHILENKEMNAWEKLSIMVEKYVDRVQKYRDFFLMMQRQQLAANNPFIEEFLKENKKKFVSMYFIAVEQGIQEGIFTKNPQVEFIHSTISGTLFTAINSVKIYKEIMDGDENYENDYTEKLKLHLKNILRYLLGYEENK